MVAGVAAGLASYFGVDATIVRIGFVVATILGGGIGIPLYIACLLLVPEEGASESIATSLIHSVADGR
jgi:phage shock protein PspC (stress-responsive transcriptional regulator)